MKTRFAAIGRNHGGPFLLYLVLAVLMTWPLVFNLTTAIPGTLSTVYPQGAGRLLEQFNPFNALVSLPFDALFGEVAAYNITLLCSLAASGYTAYLLAYDVTQNWRAALVGGAVFACSSFLLAQALGHPNLLAAEWLPLAVLAVRRASVAPGVGSIALAAVCLAVNGLCDWQYFLLVLLWGGWYALVLAWHGRSVRAAQSTALAVGLSLVLVLPLVLSSARLVQQTTDASAETISRQEYAANLFDLLIPSTLHPLWGGMAREAQAYKETIPVQDRTAYLGVVALALAVVGLRRKEVVQLPDYIRSGPAAGIFQASETIIREILPKRKPGRRKQRDEPWRSSFTRQVSMYNVRLGWWHEPRFWLLSMLVFTVLALGPWLHIGEIATDIPLPALLVLNLPLVNMVQIPLRLVVLSMLALAVLAANGARNLFITEAGLALRPLLVKNLLLVVLVQLIALDNLTAPYPLVVLSEPPSAAEEGPTLWERGATAEALTPNPSPRAGEGLPSHALWGRGATAEALTPNPSPWGRGASEPPSPRRRRGQGDEGKATVAVADALTYDRPLPGQRGAVL